MRNRLIILLMIILIGITGYTFAQPPEILPTKQCPLCGMYPARYPMFNCQIVFQDGSSEAFDSAVGLLVYLLFPDDTGIQVKSVAKIYFKDYVNETWLESDKTFFVTGSDILGPMGVEFLPVDSEQAAEELKKQEKGQEVIHFDEIDQPYMVKAAKAGWLHLLTTKLVLK